MIRRALKNFEYVTFGLSLLLCIFGLLLLYSASSYTALVDFGDDKYFMFRQAIYVGMSIIVMIVLSYLPKNVFYNLSFLAYILSLTLVILTFTVGVASHGSYRWIEINGLTFQPSEFMKYGLILYLSVSCSRFLEIKNDLTDDRKKHEVYKIAALGLVPSIIIAISNLSTSIICILITLFYVFIISEKKIYFLIILAIIISIFFFKYPIALIIEKTGLLKAYQMERIMAWADPESYQDAGYQTRQALYAIASGGIYGRGIGESLQKMILPEAHNDMIFSIIAEELGLIGSIFFIGIYMILIFRILNIAERSNDSFAKFVSYGVAIHLFLQVILNISVNLNIIPNTGVTLPFISYGGSSLLATSIEIGTVMSLKKC